MIIIVIDILIIIIIIIIITITVQLSFLYLYQVYSGGLLTLLLQYLWEYGWRKKGGPAYWWCQKF